MKKIFKTATTALTACALSLTAVAFAACSNDDEEEHVHSYGGATWTWASDYSSATASFSCTDNDDTQTVTATVTSATTTAATCTTGGVITYTASATFDGKTYTDAKTQSTEANGHTYGNELTYTEGKWYKTCSDCSDTVEVTDTSGYTLLAGSSETLAAALTLGGNIKLSANIDGESAYTIAEEKEATIDLNGKTLTLNASQSISVLGSLTVGDTGSNGTITVASAVTASNKTSLFVVNGASAILTLNGGTYNNAVYYGVYCEYGGTAVVNDGTVAGSAYGALSGNNTTGNMNFTINGGTISATYGPAIYMPGQGNLTVTGGTINGGISLRMGIVNISGGTINAIASNIDSPASYYNYSGNAWFPDALYVWAGTYTSSDTTNGNKLVLNITGGTFNCANGQGSAVAIYNIGKVEQSVTVNITGGTFKTNATNRSACQVLSLTDIGVTTPATGYGNSEYTSNISFTDTVNTAADSNN